jgi:hypothetical protein
MLLIGTCAFTDELRGMSSPQLVLTRSALTLFAPVVVLVLSELLSPKSKASLVFWKGEHALPGHAAFSVHGPADPRIDMTHLRKTIGPLPSEPEAQNATWFKLYKACEDVPSVKDANGSFLLFRDMAAMSIILTPVVPIGIFLLNRTWPVALATGAALAFQFLVTAFAARQSGIRLVTNVLATHSLSSKARAAPKTRTRRRDASGRAPTKRQR